MTRPTASPLICQYLSNGCWDRLFDSILKSLNHTLKRIVFIYSYKYPYYCGAYNRKNFSSQRQKLPIRIAFHYVYQVCRSPSLISRHDLASHMKKMFQVVSGSRADFQQYLDSDGDAGRKKKKFESAKVVHSDVGEIWYWLRQ